MWSDIFGSLLIIAGIIHLIIKRKTIRYQLGSYVKAEDSSQEHGAYKILNIRIIAGSIFLILLGIYFVFY